VVQELEASDEETGIVDALARMARGSHHHHHSQRTGPPRDSGGGGVYASPRPSSRVRNDTVSSSFLRGRGVTQAPHQDRDRDRTGAGTAAAERASGSPVGIREEDLRRRAEEMQVMRGRLNASRLSPCPLCVPSIYNYTPA